MTSTTSPRQFLKSKPLIIAALALIAQGVAVRVISRPEAVSAGPALTTFPSQFGDWQLGQEGVVDQETRDVLKADDLLTRTYFQPGAVAPTNLFIASFLSQRNGKTPHSPKNCLPGAGWVQETSEIIPVEIPGFGTVEVNHYVIANRESRSDVMYWYQSRNRVVASEYKAKVYVVADAIRYNRTDTSLVRVITPIVGRDDAPAKATNEQFVKTVLPLVQRYMPA
jgi:EpsI family protein